MEKKKITIILDNNNNLKLKLFAIKHNKTDSEIVQMLIENHLVV